MGIPTIDGTNLMTIADGTTNGKAIGSIAEVQVKRIIQNTSYYESIFRNKLIASQIADLGGIATAIYRLPERVVWSTGYDKDTGAKRQRTKANAATFQLNKIMNFKLMIEEYDMKRFLDSSPNVKGAMVGDWLGTATKSLIAGLELQFRQAIITWCIAHYNENDETPTVLVVDRSKFSTGNLDTDKANIVAFEQTLLNHMTKRLKTINRSMVGTNKEDWYLTMSYELYNSMLPAFTQFIDTTGAKTLVSGEWFENSVLGYPIQKDLFLEKEYPKGPDGGFNLDIKWNTNNVCGIIAHLEDWVNPGVFHSLTQVLEPETTNIQWVGKYLGSLPMSLRGLSTIIMTRKPTATEIEEAKAACARQGQGLGDETDWETYRCQLSEWDSLVVADGALSTYLKTTNLGELADKTADSISAGVLAKNTSLTGKTLSISNITDTSAIVSCETYTGTVNVTFTIKASVESDDEADDSNSDKSNKKK